MSFEQLLYVEVLSHDHSLSQAAELLHITKSGLSLAITELEDEMDIQIFERTKRGTFLTDEGAKLLASISDVLKAKAHLGDVALAISEKKREEIHIQYINMMFNAFMNDFVDHHELYDHVFLSISKGQTKEIIQNVRNGVIDAGFIASSEIESEWMKDIVFTPVCYGRVVLLVNEDFPALNHPMTLEELSSMKFCLFDDSYHTSLLERLERLCGPIEVFLKTDVYWAITQAVHKLSCVCLCREMHTLLSSESFDEHVRFVDVGHLINDQSALGFLTNPCVKKFEICTTYMDYVTKAIWNQMKDHKKNATL